MSDKELEQFNAHQQDLRNRANSLVRAILIVAGGALAVSIGIFAGKSSPQLSDYYAGILKIAWSCLFASIIFLVLSLVIIIARDYTFGERWRQKRQGKRICVKESRSWIERVIRGVALIGLVGFVLGMFGLAYIAASIVGTA